MGGFEAAVQSSVRWEIMERKFKYIFLINIIVVKVAFL